MMNSTHTSCLVVMHGHMDTDSCYNLQLYLWVTKMLESRLAYTGLGVDFLKHSLLFTVSFVNIRHSKSKAFSNPHSCRY